MVKTTTDDKGNKALVMSLSILKNYPQPTCHFFIDRSV
jgi:hypothetical protein